MTDAHLAAQVIMAGIDADSSQTTPLDALETRRLTDVPAGAVMLFGKNLKGNRDGIAAMNADVCRIIKEFCMVPPFIAVDHEGGRVNRFGDKIFPLPPPPPIRTYSTRKGGTRLFGAYGKMPCCRRATCALSA